MGLRLREMPTAGALSPGPIYDVPKVANFKTGPSHSFGMSAVGRFHGIGPKEP